MGYEIRNKYLDMRYTGGGDSRCITRPMTDEERKKYGMPIKVEKEPELKAEEIFTPKKPRGPRGPYKTVRSDFNLELMFRLALEYGVGRKGQRKIAEKMKIPEGTIRSYMYSKGIKKRVDETNANAVEESRAFLQLLQKGGMEQDSSKD